jgi:hypothetical protein
MKLNLLQFVAFAFMLGWVGTDVVGGATYHERVCISTFLALMTAYLNNAHGLLWAKCKNGFDKLKRAG